MFLAIIAVVLGGIYTAFGVLIAFLGRYQYLSGYTPEKGEAYALRAGLIQFVGGLLCIAGGVCGLLGLGETAVYIGLLLGVGLILLLSAANDRTAGK